MESPQAIHRPLSALAGNRLPPHAFMARNELQGRRGVRVLTLAASAVVAMLTAACGTSYRDNNDPEPSDAPVISYRYVDSEEPALAAEFADNSGEEPYGQDAAELDTHHEHRASKTPS